MRLAAGGNGAGRGRMAAVLAPVTLGLALLTASAVPAAQTLLPQEKPAFHLPAAAASASAPDARIALQTTPAPTARRAPYRTTRLRSLPTATVPSAPTTPAQTTAPVVAVTLETLSSSASATTNAVTTATTDYTRAHNPRLSARANAVPEPGTLALAVPAAFLLLPAIRRRSVR